MLNAATQVVESVPAPVDVIDGALAFAAKTLHMEQGTAPRVLVNADALWPARRGAFGPLDRITT